MRSIARIPPAGPLLAGLMLGLSLCAPGLAAAADFRSIAESGTVLYDAPSVRAQKIFVASALYPVEVVVSIDSWAKVRDVAGDLAWVEKKSLSERRTVLVKAPLADVRQSPDDAAPVVFQARQNVALELTEVGTTGWVRVRHRDGQSGYVRNAQVWGL